MYIQVVYSIKFSIIILLYVRFVFIVSRVFTEELREGKHNRRKAERLWRKTKLEIHHQLFKERCREVGKLLMRSKRTYYSDKIAECGNSQKCLFRITKNLMGHKGEIILPSCSSDEYLANKFSDFFNKRRCCDEG